MSIRSLGVNLDVAQALAEIEGHHQMWNQHRERTQKYAHSQVDDIWVRYNRKIGSPDFHGPHQPRWYPVAALLPSVVGMAYRVQELVNGQRLGGVLITRIPPGGEVKPHVDDNWHAREYRKYAVQLMGNKDQAFCFKDGSLSAEPGEVYTFDNSKLHWVVNRSAQPRMTLIICIK